MPSDVLRSLEARRDLVLDMLRVYLGTGLFFRGLGLLFTNQNVQQLAGGVTPGVSFTGIAAYVIVAHTVGGALMAVGLYTRIAALVQLPVLVGAVFFIHWQDGLLSADQSLEFSALVLFLLVLVCVFGSGSWSLDARWGTGLSTTPQPSASSSA